MGEQCVRVNLSTFYEEVQKRATDPVVVCGIFVRHDGDSF